MKRMAMLFVVLLMAVTLGTGCATLGITPSDSDLTNMENGLIAADTAEALLFAAFDTLCASNQLPVDSCTVGYAIDVEWQGAFALAMSAIADYRAGKMDKKTMQQLVSTATLTFVRVSQLIRDLNASKASTLKAKKLSQGLPKKPSI